MVDEKIEALFEVHQRIGEEIGKADYLGEEESEFNEGHINGLKEANLRVEETIYDLIEDKELAEAYQEASCGCE
jgi:hypothetical protein